MKAKPLRRVVACFRNPQSAIRNQAEAFSFFLEYFFWKRSTRPAVSTSFCLPVKNGWQFEQIST